MTAPDSVKLPNDAMMEILAFMTREQLNSLSLLSRQLAYIIRTPSFTKKPLLPVEWVDFNRAHCKACDSGDCGHDGGMVDFNLDITLPLPAFTHPGVDLDLMIHHEWLRFEGECSESERSLGFMSMTLNLPHRYSEILIWLPLNNEIAYPWLESLYVNSHCLRGCEKLRVEHHAGAITAEMRELIDKFTLLVKEVVIQQMDAWL